MHPEKAVGVTTIRVRAATCEYDVPDSAFMVVELVAGALESRAGLVRYRPEFADT
jgi:predicted N-acetyltransferase YhbS